MISRDSSPFRDGARENPVTRENDFVFIFLFKSLQTLAPSPRHRDRLPASCPCQLCHRRGRQDCEAVLPAREKVGKEYLCPRFATGTLLKHIFTAKKLYGKLPCYAKTNSPLLVHVNLVIDEVDKIVQQFSRPETKLEKNIYVLDLPLEPFCGTFFKNNSSYFFKHFTLKWIKTCLVIEPLNEYIIRNIPAEKTVPKLLLHHFGSLQFFRI